MYQMQGFSPLHHAPDIMPGAGIQAPQVDILDTGNEVLYIFEVPGVDSGKINVEVRDNTLFMEGPANLELGTDGLNYLYRERSPATKYSRIISIPQEVNSEEASANVKNGLLIVRFPRKSNSRKVSVNQQPQETTYIQQPGHQ
ncbi:MAG: Hsp20/alpha crystallin family protein [Candidatus Syntrophonatronum acetioxidans]|uniref:Hsp20/alpha crystallin family protein n=1 Tax=Candidatus Syntrophonatronum acetioxidans TaxID=1795816 RepID=A0A424YJD6_9FIRM|nr:MAG: Hsp20/alpha crystallin family protein [Candidatus Syntrophonatronum acetioxidans]